MLVPSLSTELRSLARAAESMGAFLRGAVRAGYDVCSRGCSVRELLEQAAQAVGSVEPCWQIWHDGQRIGALWAQPGCFRTPQLTVPLPGSVARGGRAPTKSPVTMSLYVDARAQMGERVRRPSGRLGELPHTGSYVGVCWTVFCSAAPAEVQVELLRAFGLKLLLKEFTLPLPSESKSQAKLKTAGRQLMLRHAMRSGKLKGDKLAGITRKAVVSKASAPSAADAAPPATATTI